MSHSMQGVYSPLPQSLSDSDSDKEISMDPLFTNYSKHNSKSTPKNSLAQNGHLFSTLNDEIVKVKRVKPKMSNSRKAAFVLSILLCFLPIVIFLWVLPCSDLYTCPVKISNWENQQHDVEFKGEINLVQGAFKNNLNLALMYKGSFNAPKLLKNGVLSFLGKSGAVAWDFRQESYPLKMNCNLIDVDSNGVNDCLIMDERGLKAVETLSGEVIWHVHSAQEKSIPDLDMPVTIDDFDEDGISELLSIYQRKSFFIISGRTGRVLSNIKILTSCSSIENLKRVNKNVQYRCVMYNETQASFQISISNIKLKYHNPHESLSTNLVHDEHASNIFITGHKKLSVEIFGQCPHCHSTLTLFNSKNAIIKTWSYKNTFTVNPVSFDLELGGVLSREGRISGFVFKIWEWHESPKKLSPGTHVHRRSIPIYNETYHMNQVSERVVFIIFHGNEPQIINVSMTDIYVICNGPDLNDCQPDYRNQQNSLLIADLDHDKSLEIVSYYSSYIKSVENNYDTWNLISRMKVFRLESELPKLYGNNTLK